MNHQKWYIPDMYWPEVTSGDQYVSHESICVLNTDCENASIQLTLYYEDRAPIGPIDCACPARRTHHIRMDKLTLSDGGNIPRGVPYAAVIESSVPVTVQYTRVDTTQPELALMSAMAFPG